MMKVSIPTLIPTWISRAMNVMKVLDPDHLLLLSTTEWSSRWRQVIRRFGGTGTTKTAVLVLEEVRQPYLPQRVSKRSWIHGTGMNSITSASTANPNSPTVPILS
jgi:hypothetical protein